MLANRSSAEMKLLFACVAVALVAQALAQPANWHFVYAPTTTPAGATIGCYDGTQYSFLWRTGTSNRVTVYLEDGGTCWDGFQTCNYAGLYDPNVNLNQVLATLATRVGLLTDTGDSRSSINDDTVLYLPSCSADFHLGTSTGLGSGQWLGRNNVDYALAHLQARLSGAPTQVNVIGASYGAVVNAAYVMQAFNQTQSFKVITDSSVGYLNATQWTNALVTWGAKMPSWIPGLSSNNLKAHADDLSSYIVSTVAAFYPQAQFGVVTTNNDTVQATVLELGGGSATSWTAQMRAALQAEHKAPNVASFIAPGSAHVLNNATAYWTLESDSVLLYKWVNDLLSGSPTLPNAVDCAPSC